MAHYGMKDAKGYKPDDEEKISSIVQADDKGASVKDRGAPLGESGGVIKNDPSAGSYYGCPDPVGADYQGAGMEKELAKYQRKTKEDAWGEDTWGKED